MQRFVTNSLIVLITLIWKQILCVGQIKSWQSFQNYGNRDLFNQFTIIFQLEHSLINSDVIKLTIPFSIGDLREYPKIQWYELSEATCIFDYLPYSLKAVQVDYTGPNDSLYEYSLVFNDTSTFMERNKWYQMQIQSGELIPSSNTDVVIKIGMATYSGISKSKSILYDENPELSTIYISPSIKDSLELPLSNQIYNKEPLKTNRIQLSIKQAIIEASGRLVINLSSSQFSFTKTSVCRSIQDSSLSNVVVMQTGTYKCTVTSSQLELIYFDQPVANQRTFVLEFDILNSVASDSLDLVVYQMEPYTNLVLDRGTRFLIKTTTIPLRSYEMYLSFGQRPSDIFQLYKSLKEYNVYNTITLKFQPQISTPDTLAQLEIELGTSYFSILQGSIQDNLPYYNPTIQTNCKSIESKLVCTGIGSLSSQTIYQISFKLLINYSYSINIIPNTFLNLALIQTSSGSQIISSNGIKAIEVRDGLPKVTDANTFAASFNSDTMPKFDDALGYLKQLQHNPSSPKTTQVLGFMIKDDGSGVVQDDKLNKGYLIYTTPKIQTLSVQPTCLSKTGTSLSGCVVDSKSELTTFRFIGDKNPFLPQSVEKSSMVLLVSNIAITSFGQMGGQEVFDFYVQTYSESLQTEVQDSNFKRQNYLVNGYVYSEVLLANQNIMAEIINYLGPNTNLQIDGYNTISLLKIKTNILEKDPMISANYDYPIRVEIFFDNMQLLPLYNNEEQDSISDPYELLRISCIGDGIKCYSIPSQVYYNPLSFNFVALNRIQVQFDSIKSMVSYNSKNILIPFIPVQNALSINMYLVLSHGIKALGMKKPIPYYKQINRLIKFSFRDASTDSTIKYNNYNFVHYNLQNVNLGQTLDSFQIKFQYQPTDPPALLTNPKYILYTTQWNFTNSFIPSSSATQFTANVQDKTFLTCTQISYKISSITTFGLLCPLILEDLTTPSLQDTYISLQRIQFPFTYGIELPRSSVSIIDSDGNLRSFSYLNSKNKLSPSVFTFKGMTPQSIMELQKGLEIVFHIQTRYSLPPNFIFKISSSDVDNSLNFSPVQIKNGCIINNDISIESSLTITTDTISCTFKNQNEIPQGDINILVVSISVLKQAVTPQNQNQVEYMKTLISRIYTSREVLLSKSDRGKKLLYQRQRQYGDSSSKITIDSINIKQIRKDNHMISFVLNFQQKDWDDFENLRCDFSSILKQLPQGIDCEITDLTNNKMNFIQQCFFDGMNLLATRNLDIKLYPVSNVYSYKIIISNIGSDTILMQNELSNGIFSCASVEPKSNNSILEMDIPIQSIQVNYDFINISPVGPVNGEMKIIKYFTYPGLDGQLKITFSPKNTADETVWPKNTLFQLSFPSRYISGLSNRDYISCYQNNMVIPCQMIYSHTLQIDSLAQDSKPSSLIFELVGIKEPSALLELDSLGNPKIFELLVINGKNNQKLSYYNEYDTNFSKTSLEKIRFLNSSQSDNQTYVNSDFYNFTLVFPKDTPQRTKLVLEFPLSYTEILNNYQPESCVLKAANIKDISLQCIGQSNRISITSDISNTFVLSKGIQYTLSIKGLKNPYQASRCNTEKVNILVFDEATDSKQLFMVSGESQSAARNVSLTSETTLNSFNISKTTINLVYGVISEEITITINKQQRSSKHIEFSNKFNRYIQINPTVPIIPIGEYQTTFTISVIDPSIQGQFTFFISQFSSVSSPVIKDVPPITLNIINPADESTIQSTFQIKLPITHLLIPIGGYSLPLAISLDTYKPQTQLIINSNIVDLPENGVSINKGAQITFSSTYSSSYILLKSDGSISKIGARGILQLALAGENAKSFYLVDKIVTFEIVQQELVQSSTSSTISQKDLQIYINPSTLSPISQIIQVLSTQSLTLYYSITSNFTQFNEISLKDIISNLQKGLVQEQNYLNQRQTQYGSWNYQANSGLQDFYLNRLYENRFYLLKIFPLNRQGQFLGQFIGNFTTSNNSGKLLKTVFRFQSAVSIAQQIDLACKLSQYFAINQLFLTTTTGVRCDSPSNLVDTKIQNKKIQISALDNPNPQFVSFYFSYNKEDLYNNYNSQIYALLINQKSTIISWYASQISSNRFFQKLLDYQASNNIQTAQPYMVSNSTQYIKSQKWIYVQDIQLSSNGYVWIMVDSIGNFPPNYLQIRQNLNSQNKQALTNYVSYFSVITNKKVAFNVTGLASQTSYDFFFAVTSDDSSDNMSYPPIIYSLTLTTN